MPDYIPRRENQFFQWSENLIRRVEDKAAEFRIDGEAIAPQAEKFAVFKSAYEIAGEPNRGKADVLRKSEARKALEKGLRVFIKAYLAFNPSVSAMDRELLGLPTPKTTRSPVQPPKTVPVVQVDSSLIRQVLVYFRDAESVRRGKPANVRGLELHFAIREDPPQSVEDLTKIETATASPFGLTFDESERGKSLYICSCWINNRQERGPYGEIVRAIIP